jgi:hypothetical protein
MLYAGGFVRKEVLGRTYLVGGYKIPHSISQRLLLELPAAILALSQNIIRPADN